MSDFKFACLHCNQHLEAPPEMFGTVIACPSCNKQIQVPQLASQPPSRGNQHSTPLNRDATPMIQKIASRAQLIGVGAGGAIVGVFIAELLLGGMMLALGDAVMLGNVPGWMKLAPAFVMVAGGVAGAWLMLRLWKESHATKTCPICAGKDIVKVESEQVTAVNGDRFCRSCQTQWTPAVSKLAASVKLTCSGFMVLVSIGVFLIGLFNQDYFKYKGLGPVVAIVLAIGVGAGSVRMIISTFRILRGKGGEMKIVRQGNH